MKTLCVIPARYASSRLPGKPLADIGGKPMVQRVYERASRSVKIDKVIVATDHQDILNAVLQFGGEAVMTDPDLPSGSDRVAEVSKQSDAEIVINLQGDEPFVAPQLLDHLIGRFDDSEIEMATPVRRITDTDTLFDPNVVHVVRDVAGFALYFSRSPIPFARDAGTNSDWLDAGIFYKHIGIYAYRRETLFRLTALPISANEKIERLEQLRALDNGIRIYTLETDYDSIGVDTAEDLERVNKLLLTNKLS